MSNAFALYYYRDFQTYNEERAATIVLEAFMIYLKIADAFHFDENDAYYKHNTSLSHNHDRIIAE